MFMKHVFPILIGEIIRAMLRMNDEKHRKYSDAWRELFYRRQGTKYRRESKPAPEDPLDPP